MNTNMMNKLSTKYVSDLKDSDYEFNRFDKASLRDAVNVVQLSVTTENHSSWIHATALIYDAINKMFSSNSHEIYCFIVSPYWKPDSRIVRHYGLGRTLDKDFDVGTLDFLFEKEIVNDKDVIFYGVVKLTSANASRVFKLLSLYENGVLFSRYSSDDYDVSLLVEELAALVAIKPKSLTFNLNIVEAINLILGRGSEVLFPYSWEETGEYHLDIFKDGQDL